MRPGLTIDFDHISRYEKYIRIVRSKVEANSALGFSPNNTFGYSVADNLSKKAHVIDKIKSFQKENMEWINWKDLLAQYKHQWKDYLEVLKERASNDERLKVIINPVISNSVSDEKVENQL